MKTTLNQIRAHEPCREGWEKLLRGLGKTKADDEIIWIDQVLNCNGLDDALWCLRAVEGFDREIRLYAVWCARRVQHLMDDPRSVVALDVAERFAGGEASGEELAEAEEEAAEAAEAAWGARAARAAWAAWGATAAAAWGARAARAAVAAVAAARAEEEAAEEARDTERAAQAKELRRICREMREDGR
jgi:hypothetical protein